MILKSPWIRLLPAVLLVLGYVFAQHQTALAALPTNSVFELDGNACQDAAASADWSSFNGNGFNNTRPSPNHCPANPGTPANSPVTKLLVDDRPATDTTYFTGGGSKIGSPLSGWLNGGSAPNKAEIEHSFAAQYNVGGQNVTYFGQDRSANNGDTNIGFWFFRNSVACCNASNQFVGSNGNRTVHSDGDDLILSDFTNGGSAPTIQLYQWRCTAGATPTGQLCGTPGAETGSLVQVAAPGQADCSSVNRATANLCAIVNHVNVQTPWDTNTSPNGTLAPVEFFEGAVNLSALSPGGACFSSYMGVTDSAQSTANNVMKDFALGGFDTCAARVTISPHEATNEVGHPHTMTVETDASSDSGSSFTPAPSSAVSIKIASGSGKITGGNCFTSAQQASLASSPSAGPVSGTTANSSGVAVDGSAQAAGTCKVTINQSTAGTTTVHVDATVTVGGATKQVSTSSTATDNTGDAIKHYVDAGISLSPLTATNEVNSQHTITATVKQNAGDGSGFVNAPDGTTVTFTLLNNTAGATFVGGVSSCNTSGGSCSIKINTSTAGSVDIHATTTFSVGGVSLTRATDGGGNLPNSGNANKVYVDANIGVSPLTADNSVGSPHTITATVQQNDGLAAGATGGDSCTGFCPAPNGTTVTFSLLNNTAGAGFVPTGANSCTISNGLGTCSVQINSNTPGSVTIRATTTFNVGPSGAQKSLTRTTNDGLTGDSSDAVKVYHAGSIKLTKTVELGALTPAPNVCFTLARTDGGTLILKSGETAQQCFSGWTPGGPSHVFQWDGLATGTYSITETVPFPYTANPPITGIQVNANSSDPSLDQGTLSNPLPKGNLQIQKNINGALAPVNGDQFSFTYAYCGADATCANPGNPVTIKVPGCQVADGSPQPTSGCSNQNPVLITGLLEGYYQITEQQPAPSSPYQIDPATQNPQIVAVNAGNNLPGGGGVPLSTFNNVKLYKLILVACDMKNNLTPTDATLTKPDNSVVGPKTSVASGGYPGFTDSQLCQIPGANFGSLVTGSYTLNIASLPNP